VRIRALFISAGAAALLIGGLAIGAMWKATSEESASDEQQQQAQQVARDVAGLVGVTFVFQRERDELSVAEWKQWHAGIVNGLRNADPNSTSRSEIEMLRDAAGRLPGLFETALQTSVAPANDFERRRRDQAFDLLLGDTQAMADAAFRWSRNAGDARREAEGIHTRITAAAIVTFILLLIGLATLGVQRVLRPLIRLTAAAEALERGDHAPLSDSKAQNEIGTLNRRFDSMAVALQRRTAELREAERRMRAIADSIPVLVTEFDKDARIVFANATAGKTYGLPADELVGKSIRDIRGEDGEMQLRPRIQAALQGQPIEFDSTQVLHGTLRHFHQLYVPRWDEDGVAIGFYSVSMDITDRKANELALQASEQRLASILRQSPDAFVCTDSDGNIADWNPAATSIFGWDREEVRGRRLAEVLVPPEHRAAHDAGMGAFLSSGQGPIIGKRLELPALHRDGSIVPTELSIGALHTADGFAAFAFLRDIRERLAAQEALKNSQSRLQQVLGTIPALVGYFDRDMRCRYANGLARKLQGFAAGEEIGLHLRDAIGEDNFSLHEPYLPTVLSGKRAHFESTIQRGGRDVHFQVHLVPEISSAGDVSGFYLMTFDITALKEAELEQQRSQRRLQAITDNLPVMISYIDAEHRLQFLNKTFQDWTGIATVTALGQPMSKVLGTHLYEHRREPLEDALRGQRIDFEVESEALGVRRVLQTSYVPDAAGDGTVMGVYALTTDVTSLRQAERRMADLALTDTLTGLANRRSFEQALPQALARARRRSTGAGLMFLDVDHFKRINDNFGHAGGDAVLVSFAHRLASSVRETDFVARLAGDEFVVVLEGLNDVDECHVIARKVNATVARQVIYEGQDLAVTTSIGLAYMPAGLRCSPEDLLRHADEALYRTKDRGRDGYTVVEVGESETQFSPSSFAGL
jgi:diguanylate cyclase (GGDEF)-like protein/PAS domain S-box-containing protein